MLHVAFGTRLNDNGKPVAHRRDVGLGSYPEVLLVKALKRSANCASRFGVASTPSNRRSKTAKPCAFSSLRQRPFRECVEVLIANKSRELKNAKHIAQ